MRALRISRLLVAVALGSLSACSLLLTDGDFTGTPLDAAVDGSNEAGADAPTNYGPQVSCRALHATDPSAKSGAYSVASDGGLIQTYCDMESFDGGWTLVTKEMVVEDRATQDIQPTGMKNVDVVRGVDENGGIQYQVSVLVSACGNSSIPSPIHYFLVGELDGWTQIMATYAFYKYANCWNIFGDPGVKNTNVRAFDIATDLIDQQSGMARSATGEVIPFGGRTNECNEAKDNFWLDAYGSELKGGRVVLRRFSAGLPAGLAVQADCGSPQWGISKIYVR